jgi:hypothetical protein
MLRAITGKTPSLHDGQEAWRLAFAGCGMAKVTVRGEFSRRGEHWYLKQLQFFTHWLRNLIPPFSVCELLQNSPIYEQALLSGHTWTGAFCSLEWVLCHLNAVTLLLISCVCVCVCVYAILSSLQLHLVHAFKGLSWKINLWSWTSRGLAQGRTDWR